MKPRSAFKAEIEFLRAAIGAAPLLPDEYAGYSALIADGLEFFLQRLSATRLRAIFDEQAELPFGTETAERLVRLLQHIPALHKLGQVLARNRRLRPRFRRLLQQLEVLPPVTERTTIDRLLDRELTSGTRAGLRISARPLAEGSVAVVIPFSIARPPDSLGTAGVLKVLKPGIRQRLGEDLEILSQLGGFLDSDCERYKLPALDYAETFETIRDLLQNEVRLKTEQKNMREARAVPGVAGNVSIPGLYPFCTDRLTAMERIAGCKVSSAALSQPARRHLTRVATEALLARPMYATVPAIFHADPHAGNLVATEDGKLGILDWSLCGHLSPVHGHALVQLIVGGFFGDLARMQAAVGELSECSTTPDLSPALAAASWELTPGSLPGVAWVTRLLDRLVVETGLRLDRNLLLFRKALLTLEGVLADLLKGGEAERDRLMDESAVSMFLGQLAAEWPLRICAAPGSRRFASHLSNLDLLQLGALMPGFAVRLWGQTSLGLVSAFRTGFRGT